MERSPSWIQEKGSPGQGKDARGRWKEKRKEMKELEKERGIVDGKEEKKRGQTFHTGISFSSLNPTLTARDGIRAIATIFAI